MGREINYYLDAAERVVKRNEHLIYRPPPPKGKPCGNCDGLGLVPDFDCYHGRVDQSPVQCAECKGTGRTGARR